MFGLEHRPLQAQNDKHGGNFGGMATLSPGYAYALFKLY